MNTLQISASLSRAAGGIFEIELAIARQLVNQGVGVRAMGLKDAQWTEDAGRWQGLAVNVFDTSGPRAFGYAPGLYQKMIGCDADLAHLHYMWMYPSVAVTKWATKTGRPYIATPNGMLEPWALSNSAWKKKLAGLLYENRMLRGAACLQANTEKELRDIRAYGLKNPICIIPNGVDLVEIGDRRSEIGDQKKTLLFLGRLHPKKGLVNALRAWHSHLQSTIHNPRSTDWQFVIAGWDQGGHEAELKRLCDELGLAWRDGKELSVVGCRLSEVLDVGAQHSSSSLQMRGTRVEQSTMTRSTDNRQQTTDNNASVIFTGPAFGEAKEALLRSASAFILPSFSEGLPMSVLEAWSYRLPVLMTDHCNLPEGFANNAAIRIGTDVESIAEGMRELMSLPEEELSVVGSRLSDALDVGAAHFPSSTQMPGSREERSATSAIYRQRTTDNGQRTSSLASMGLNGRTLVEQHFTWPQVATQMKEVYEWVLGGGDVPDCVRQF